MNEKERRKIDELMSQLREEARKQGKLFGLYFENIEGGFTTTSRGSANAFNVLPNVVYRIYTDGREPELVPAPRRYCWVAVTRR